MSTKSKEQFELWEIGLRSKVTEFWFDKEEEETSTTKIEVIVFEPCLQFAQNGGKCEREREREEREIASI